MAQYQAAQVGQRTMPHRTAEIDGPLCGCRAGRVVANDEGRLRQIEFQIQRGRARGAHNQRGDEIDRDWRRQIRAAALGIHHVNIGTGYGRAGGEGKAHFRVGRGSQQYVSRIAAHCHDRAGVRADRNRRIAEDFGQLIQLLKIDEGRRGRGRIDLTLLPPPCGISAMLNTFTPMVAQSSEDASLIIIGIALAVCEAGACPMPWLNPM